jgi:cellulose synthase/poly-beta-1,6-N-acetylglucosamine synthase-like glycosyltransferase
MFKVLVAVPYHRKKDYCLPELLESLHQLDYPKDKMDIVLRMHTAEYGEIDAVKKQRQFFAELALSGGYDYLFFHGADTIPPPDAIKRLMLHGKDIVSGVYFGRAGAENGRTNTAVAWKHTIAPEVLGERLAKANEEPFAIDGFGMDCILIKRKVLEKVDWTMWKVNDDDYPFCDLAKSKGFNLLIDPQVQCKHYFEKGGYVYKGQAFYDENK